MSANWLVGKLVKKDMAAVNVMSLTFELPGWVKHMAGQHYDIRLTAPGGYQAERSYSAASAPEDEGIIQYGVQLLPGGEVSGYLNAIDVGTEVEMRGPLGGHFIWSTEMPGPLILIGGGSGMVPLMCMLRHHLKHPEDKNREIIFLISARTLEHVLWRDELEKIQKQDSNIKVVLTLTDNPPPDWAGYKRRIDLEMLTEVFGNQIQTKMPMTYICGPTPFVEAVANHMIKLGFTPHSIKTERFGG